MAGLAMNCKKNLAGWVDGRKITKHAPQHRSTIIGLQMCTLSASDNRLYIFSTFINGENMRTGVM